MSKPIPSTDAAWEKLIVQISQQVAILLDAPADSAPPKTLSSSKIAQLIDHTLLATSATSPQIAQLCSEAAKYNFRTVCVRPEQVANAKSNLSSSSSSTLIGIACVIGFPEGTQRTASKVAEVQQAVADGATELDMVINYEALKQREFVDVYFDVLAVREAAVAVKQPIGLKVIIETGQLAEHEDRSLRDTERRNITSACVVAIVAGADYVKTSTGFRGRGAMTQDVEIMSKVCQVMQQEGWTGERTVQVKASGGIRTVEDVTKMYDAGATRIGASAGVAIMKGILTGDENAAERKEFDQVVGGY